MLSNKRVYELQLKVLLGKHIPAVVYTKIRQPFIFRWCRYTIVKYPGESYNADEELSSTSEHLLMT